MTRSLVKKMLALFAGIFFVGGAVAAGFQLPAKQDLTEAEKLLRDQRPREALVILKNVVKENKQYADAWYDMGVAYLQLRDLKAAETAFETATKINPQYAEAQSGLAYTYLRRGKIGQSSIAANNALSIDQNNANAHYTLGVLFFRSGDRPQAVEHADLAIKANPNLAEAYLLKSQALVPFFAGAIVQSDLEAKEFRKTRYRQAAGALEAYLRLVPDNENSGIWKDQLESLRFYSDDAVKTAAYTGKQVTTKARLLSKPEPSYTDEARESGVAGTVVLRAVFASDGQVKHILVIQSLPDGLTEKAVNAARKIRFVPASIDGRPVSMWIQLEYNFNL